MTVSELIAKLTDVLHNHGDLPVVYPDWVTDRCGAGEVMSLEVRRAKSPKKDSHIYWYMRGPYAKNRYIRKDETIVELRDYN